ncbi:MEF2BNB-like protein [Sarcoptes scabiei]|nr:MEF2BNB-like protein [Sarcoptes scabiei]
MDDDAFVSVENSIGQEISQPNGLSTNLIDESSESAKTEEIAQINSCLHGINSDDNETSIEVPEEKIVSGEAFSNSDNVHSDEEESDEEEEDDNVQITIGEIDLKSSLSSSGYINLNLQKGGRQFAQNASIGSKTSSKSAIDLDAVGTYNGSQIYDVSIDSIEDKPWCKPGSDITDYFNYGFNEETWKVYCERQKRIRSMNQKGEFDINSALNMSLNSSTNTLASSSKMANEIQKDESLQASNFDQKLPIQTINENSKYNTSGSIVSINTQHLASSNKKPNFPIMQTNLKQSIDVIPPKSQTPALPLVPPPPPSLAIGNSLLGPRPNFNSNPLLQKNHMNTSDRSENGPISIMNNSAPLSFPPPLQMPPPPLPPPFGFPPPHDPHFPSMRPPPPPIGLLGPNGQLNFGGSEFPSPNLRSFPPPPGPMLSHPTEQRPFDDFDERRRRPISDHEEFDREPRSSRDRYRTNDREYDDRNSSSRHSYRDRNARSRERSRERTSHSETSSSSRSRNTKDREGRKEKEKDRDHREKESSKSSSKSKHSGESSSSSDHKYRSTHSSSTSSTSKSKSKRDSSSSKSSSSHSKSKDYSKKESSDR